MNNKRRKKLADIAESITIVKMEAKEANWKSSVIKDIEDIKSLIEKVLYEEQDYFDNMPENLQGSMQGCDAEEAIDVIQEGIDSLDKIIDDLQNDEQEMDIQDVVEELEDICEELKLL